MHGETQLSNLRAHKYNRTLRKIKHALTILKIGSLTTTVLRYQTVQDRKLSFLALRGDQEKMQNTLYKFPVAYPTKLLAVPPARTFGRGTYCNILRPISESAPKFKSSDQIERLQKRQARSYQPPKKSVCSSMYKYHHAARGSFVSRHGKSERSPYPSTSNLGCAAWPMLKSSVVFGTSAPKRLTP